MHPFEQLLLVLTSIPLLIFPESKILFQIIMFAGTVITIHLFYRMMKHSHLFKLGNVASFSILLGYVVSTTVHSITNTIMYGNVDYTTNFYGLNYSQTDISIALLIVLGISILLSVISRFEKQLLVMDKLQAGLSRRATWIIIFSTILVMIAFANGDISFMGVYLNEELRRISPIGALCFIMIPILATISAAVYFDSHFQFIKSRRLFLILAFILCVSLVPLGRRVLIYTLILILFLRGPHIIKKVRKRETGVFHILLILLITSVIIFYCFRVFYAFRIAVSTMAVEKKPPTMEIIPHAVDLFQSSPGQAAIHEKLVKNISYRFFILSYLAGLIAAHHEHETPFLGELKHALALAIPSFIYSKKAQLPPTPENFVHPSLGLPVFDGPNTIIISGLNDMGWIGMIIYPIGIVALYILLYRLVCARCPPFLSAFIVLHFLYSLLYVENSLGRWVGSGLRDLAVVSFGYWIILKLPLKQLITKRIRRVSNA
jgi:hypothetical protein